LEVWQQRCVLNAAAWISYYTSVTSQPAELLAQPQMVPAVSNTAREEHASVMFLSSRQPVSQGGNESLGVSNHRS